MIRLRLMICPFALCCTPFGSPAADAHTMDSIVCTFVGPDCTHGLMSAIDNTSSDGQHKERVYLAPSLILPAPALLLLPLTLY